MNALHATPVTMLNGAIDLEQRSYTAPVLDNARRALVILGMHRSGTSALTRVLNLLGAEVGANLMPATRDNELGYWENSTFVEKNDALLKAFGMGWDTAVRMPPGWKNTSIARNMVSELKSSIEQEFGSAQLITIKDPRLCLLAPLWEQALESLGYRTSYLLMVRHPDEVASSLERRNRFPREKSYLLWAQHFLESEAATRNSARVVVDYAELLADWRGVIARVEQTLGVRWPNPAETTMESISTFLDPALRHQKICEKYPPVKQDSAAFVVEMYLAAAQASSLDQCPSLPRLEDVADNYYRLLERVHSKKYANEVIEQNAQTSAELMLWTSRHQAQSRDVCKLYWRQEQGAFHESACQATEYAFGQLAVNMLAEFDKSGAPDFVRIDPSEWPGLFALDSFNVNAVAISDLASRVSAVHGHRFDDRAEEVRFAGFGPDPFVEIDLRGVFPARDGESTSRLSFRASRIGIKADLSALEQRLGALDSAISRQGEGLISSSERIDLVTELVHQHASEQTRVAKSQQQDSAKIRAELEVIGLILDQNAQLMDKIVSGLSLLTSGLQALEHRQETHSFELSAQIRGAHDTIGNRMHVIGEQLNALHESLRVENKDVRDDLLRFFEVLEGRERSLATSLTELQSRLEDQGSKQANIHAWVNRRSPSYWWRRWRNKG